MMRQIVDLTDQHFGDLTVIRYIPRVTRNTHSHWLCVCSCGRFVIARSDNLKDGRTTKCSVCRGNSGRQSVFFIEGGDIHENKI